VAAVAREQPGLSDAAVQFLRGMQAWPSCLLAEFPQLTMHMALQDVADMWASAAAPSSPADIDAVLQVCNQVSAHLLLLLHACCVLYRKKKRGLMVQRLNPVRTCPQAPHSGYMQQRLLAALPDLEDMWQYNYQDMLLGLPLPAVQLLLETDVLKVGHLLLSVSTLRAH
jgi:hypothetical protein